MKITQTFAPALLAILVGFLSLSASPTDEPQGEPQEVALRVSVDPDQILSVDIDPSEFIAKLETQLAQSNELVEEAISDLEVQQDKIKRQEDQLDQYSDTLKFLRAAGNTDRGVLAQVAENTEDPNVQAALEKLITAVGNYDFGDASGSCTCGPKWTSVNAKVAALEQRLAALEAKCSGVSSSGYRLSTTRSAQGVVMLGPGECCPDCGNTYDANLAMMASAPVVSSSPVVTTTPMVATSSPTRTVTRTQKYCDPATGECYDVSSSRTGWYPGKILFRNRR